MPYTSYILSNDFKKFKLLLIFYVCFVNKSHKSVIIVWSEPPAIPEYANIDARYTNLII